MNRGVEIADAVADGPRSRVLRQVTLGVAVRMAVLARACGVSSRDMSGRSVVTMRLDLSEWPVQAPQCLGPGVLALADGRVFRGLGFGARTTTVGEVVFNTAMSGYQEIVTDPSYTGQLVCLTVAEVGNVGVNVDDEESRGHGCAGLIVRSLAPRPSNYRRDAAGLPGYLERRGLPGICELDTRALTRHLREAGAVMAALSTESIDVEKLIALARVGAQDGGAGPDARGERRRAHAWDERELGRPPPATDVHIVCWDFGVKLNLLRRLRDEGARVTVVPTSTTAAEIVALRPDGVLLSNGPGDPAAVTAVIAELQSCCCATEVPIFGVCLGHQLLALALGGRTYKMKFGHHGGNHPVRHEDSRRVAITSQNHGFAVDLRSLGGGGADAPSTCSMAHAPGLRLRDRPVASVQYHPEASPGPHDASDLLTGLRGPGPAPSRARARASCEPRPVVERPAPEPGELMPERGLAAVRLDLPDMSDRTWWEGQLDRLAERVFAGRGPGRAAPLLARWDAQVGKLGAGDATTSCCRRPRRLGAVRRGAGRAGGDVGVAGGARARAGGGAGRGGAGAGALAGRAVRGVAGATGGAARAHPRAVSADRRSGAGGLARRARRIAALWELRVVFTPRRGPPVSPADRVPARDLAAADAGARAALARPAARPRSDAAATDAAAMWTRARRPDVRARVDRRLSRAPARTAPNRRPATARRVRPSRAASTGGATGGTTSDAADHR
jgi:carbamoyl-phosphate synthase small subunit